MRHRGPVTPLLDRHPFTGTLYTEPIGYVNGRAIYPIGGGAPDDDDDDKDKGGDGTGDSGAGGDDDANKNGNSGADDGGDGSDKEDPEVLRKRLQAADRRASEAERKLKAIEDAKKDDLTKATDRVTELESTLEEKDKEINRLRLQNAFLTANKHSWHEPETALALADNQGYLEDVIGEDGTVDKKRLASALDRLAKEKAFLVKTDTDKKDEPGSPSGEPAGGRSDNGKDDKAAKEQLRKRFPVLNR